MGRLCEYDASSNYMQKDISPSISSWPITICAWVRFDEILPEAEADQYVVTLYTSDTRYSALRTFDGTDIGFDCRSSSNISYRHNPKHTLSSGVHEDQVIHMCGVNENANSGKYYENGVLIDTDTAALDINREYEEIRIGRSTTTTTEGIAGGVSHVAVWDVALTSGEIKALSMGVSPLNIRPSGLVEYFPLDGLSDPENSLIGADPINISGTLSRDYLGPVVPYSSSFAKATVPFIVDDAILVYDSFFRGYNTGFFVGMR